MALLLLDAVRQNSADRSGAVNVSNSCRCDESRGDGDIDAAAHDVLGKIVEICDVGEVVGDSIGC